MKTAVPSDAGLQSSVVMGSAGGYQEATTVSEPVAWIRRKELGSGDDLGDDAYTLGTFPCLHRLQLVMFFISVA